jgi:hypothetical protein
MRIILKAPASASTLLRFLGPVAVTCFALTAAFAACMDNPDPESPMTRISHLNEAPKTIRDLAKAIQGKNRTQIRDIIILRYGPSRHIGSGLDIEIWDVSGGDLMLHPLYGPSFAPKERKPIWLLTTTNKALPNILGSFEMTALPDHRGMQNWLGLVLLHSERTYRFRDSHAFPGQWTTQTDNFFKLHPSGAFEIEFAPGCTGETLLESLPENTVLCRLIFTSKGGGQTAMYSIVTDDRKLVFRSDHAPTFAMEKSWHDFWQ